VGAQLVNGVRMSTDLSLFGHLSHPQTNGTAGELWRMASRESVPQFGLAAYPHLYPHPDDTGRHQAARSYHSRVVISN
jgi:hypothetical protein